MNTSNPRRLMIFTDSYPPYDRGGADRIAYYHAKGFRDLGWRIGVVCGRASGDITPNINEEEGIKVYRLFRLYPFSKGPDPLPIDKAFQLSSTVLNPMMVPTLQRAIKEFSPNILHAHHIPRISYGAFSKVKPNLPRVLTFHNYHYECPKGGLFRKRKKSICENKPIGCQIFQSAINQKLASVNQIIAISKFIEQRLLSAGTPSSKVVYIPNGVPNLERRRFEPPSTSREVLYVGRIDHNKGLRSLIDAFISISDTSARLTIVGDGPTRREIVQAAENDYRIRFLGWQTPEEVAICYRRARMIVVPSIWHEVMNTVICEAQSWGRPVIATDVGGNSDMIQEGKTGFLVPPGDTNLLRLKIHDLLKDDQTTDKVGQSGWQSVKRFGMSRHLNSLSDLYDLLPTSNQ